MKLHIIAALISITTCSYAAEWSIYWEAAKGETTVSVPYQPKEFSVFLTELPAGHFEADADIHAGYTPAQATVVPLGTFKGRKIFSVEQQVQDSYYNRYHFILAEVEPDKFFPIYVNQYAVGHTSHNQPVFADHGDSFSVSISVTVLGTAPSTITHKITSNLKTQPKAEQVIAGNPLDAE